MRLIVRNCRRPPFPKLSSSVYFAKNDNYKDKKFIFGPFLDFFPPKIISSFTDLKNCTVLHEFKWKHEFWKNLGINNHISMKHIDFPINSLVYNDVKENKNDYFIYFSKRKEGDLHYLKSFMLSRKISNYKVFYEENDDLYNYAKKCKIGIVLTSIHTNVINKLLCCDIPLLVWNMQTMSSDHTYKYPPIEVNNLEIWNNCCGESFFDCIELGGKFDKMLKNYNTYSPRDYIHYNLNKNKFINNFTNVEESLIIEKIVKQESIETIKKPKGEINNIVQPKKQIKPKKRGIFSAMFRI